MVEGTEYPLLPGALFLFRPLEYHYVCPKEGTPYDRYVINFGAGIPVDAAATLPFLEKEGAFGGNGIYYQDKDGTAEKIFSLVALRESGNAPLSQSVLRGIVTQALALLSRAEVACNGAEDTITSNIIAYLNENLGGELNLDEVAKHFFISKYYLCRVFRKKTGVSVIHFVNTKRVAKAKQLIAGGMSAADAALEAGFRDYSVFYRACKKSTGRAPVSERSNPKA